MKILIWGVGERTKNYIRRGYFFDCQIEGFVDMMPETDTYEGKKLYSPQTINEVIDSVDYVIVCNQLFNRALEICLNIGIKSEKLVFTEGMDELFFSQNLETIRKISPMLAADVCLHRYSLIGLNEKDYYDDNMDVGKGKFAHSRYKKDYFRYRTFEFVAQELEVYDVVGETAEFGVFRGAFASLINKKLPSRKLYLFDTFEGFDEEELKKEIDLGRTDEEFGKFYSNTSEDTVRQGMPYPEKVIFCKGLFPHSVTKGAEEARYCFVSIDVDFEESIYQGLKFFYPRLSEGGYIFIHDYNSVHLVGVRNAVRKFENEINIKIKKVPLADRSGTLVIVK